MGAARTQGVASFVLPLGEMITLARADAHRADVIEKTTRETETLVSTLTGDT